MSDAADDGFSLRPLQQALATLRRALATLRDALEHPMSDLPADLVRDARIKRFEYSYELSWKTLQRFLAEFVGADERLTIPNTYRRAAREGLLPSPVAVWLEYHRARNLTDHSYSEEVANEVYQLVPGFLTDAERLADAMAARMESGRPQPSDGN